MSLWTWNWIRSDGKARTCHPVANFDRLKEIHEEMGGGGYESGGVEVKLWHIPHHENGDDDALARRALDEYLGMRRGCKHLRPGC
ncbi:hypothetical protein GGR53DRAFT_89866 [Hypoxylon sp. FL1150]|nr:hypothetical protein GGR53DRAFT_89866 [Hypoxylon sp. FL1150]